MIIVKVERIVVKPFEMISILDFIGIQQVNEHSYIKISGIIPTDKKEAYIRLAMDETWVKITAFDENGQEEVLFYGILDHFRMDQNKDYNEMTLVVYSGTKLMDFSEHITSFQDQQTTYGMAVRQCDQRYLKANTMLINGEDQLLPHFIIQYGETDWHFLKRLASSLNTVLVPYCRKEGIKCFFGIPDKRPKVILDETVYELVQDAEHYHLLNQNDLIISFSGAVCYIVESREVLELADHLEFDQKLCCVWKIESYFKGYELYHKYYLKLKEGFHVLPEYNQKLIGLSLDGQIIGVRDESVQIVLVQEENPEPGYCWFPYSTIYSSPDGAGWYCMPEIGDRIRLYFPSENEKNAYVVSSVHENQGGKIRTNPDHKIWRNKDGKEIRMTPDKISLTNNKGMSVELSDHNGIEISSNKSVKIKAAGQINIQSRQAGLELSASSKIILRQGETKMELADGIRLSGGSVNLQ